MMRNHIMCTSKIFTDLCFTKKSCLQCFSSENVLIKHNEDFLNINGVQFIKAEEGTIEFENYFNQIPV